MNLKKIMVPVLTVFVGVGLGTVGTVAVQKFILKTPAAAATSAPAPAGPLLPIGEFTVNLQGGAYLKTSITVELTDAKAEAQLKEEDAFLKDRVNTVLANKSLVDVQTTAAREKLRQELIKKLNEVADNKIKDVLFVSLVYQ